MTRSSVVLLAFSQKSGFLGVVVTKTELLGDVPQPLRADMLGILHLKHRSVELRSSMTEQQIIERIRSMTSVADVDLQHRTVHQMQDYIHQVRDGEKVAGAEWLNSSPLLFPEDFTDEMNELSSERAISDKLLKQLDRIEAALEERKKELKAAEEWNQAQTQVQQPPLRK